MHNLTHPLLSRNLIVLLCNFVNQAGKITYFNIVSSVKKKNFILKKNLYVMRGVSLSILAVFPQNELPKCELAKNRHTPKVSTSLKWK